MMRQWILLTALAVAACSGNGDEGEGGSPAASVALVTLAPVADGNAGEQLTLYGAAEAGAEGKLSLVAPAEARVLSIDAPVGTPVARGQVVARLGASPTTRTDAAKAGADAAAADKALARSQRLRGDGLGSDAEVETARAAAAAADAARASFTDRAGGLTLRASAAGVVETVTVAPGDLAQTGAAVATVVRGGDLRLRFGVDPDTARLVHRGMALHIVGAGNRAPLTVPVESVSPAVDPQTRLAAVFAKVPAASSVIAGQTLTATLDLASGGAALTIPYAALLDDAGQPYVYVVSGDIAHRRDIATTGSGGERVTVTHGLQRGERIVTQGGTALEDGMKVRTR